MASHDTPVHEPEHSPRRRKEQIEFRAPALWIEEVQAAADSLRLSVSAFVRLAVVEKMRRLQQGKD